MVVAGAVFAEEWEEGVGEEEVEESGYEGWDEEDLVVVFLLARVLDGYADMAFLWTYFCDVCEGAHLVVMCPGGVALSSS